MKESNLQTSIGQSKIVVLWAAPRCVSTAFEKTFAQRSDTEIVHEPFCDVYFFSKWRRSARFGECEELLDYSSAKAIEHITSRSAPVVFIKEHAYQALPYIDRDFLAGAINTFIVRHPLKVIDSWYRVNEHPTEEEFGFSTLYKIWQIVTEELKQSPIVVEAECFRQNPEQVLRKYCQQIGVEFDSQMLGWKNGQLKAWSPREAEFHAKWHKTLDNSTKILPPEDIKTTATTRFIREHSEMLQQAHTIYNTLKLSSCRTLELE